MEAVQHKKKKDLVIDFSRLWAALVRRKKTYFKVIPTVILVVWIISLGLPDYYKCKIQLAPEENAGGSSGTLAMLASSFGVNIGGGSNSADAITVMLYPDLMKSTDFKTSLFPIKVHGKKDKAPRTYYDYLKNDWKEPWWEDFFGLMAPEKKQDTLVNNFELTGEQARIANMINKNIVCIINKKTGLGIW